MIGYKDWITFFYSNSVARSSFSGHLHPVGSAASQGQRSHTQSGMVAFAGRLANPKLTRRSHSIAARCWISPRSAQLRSTGIGSLVCRSCNPMIARDLWVTILGHWKASEKVPIQLASKHWPYNRFSQREDLSSKLCIKWQENTYDLFSKKSSGLPSADCSKLVLLTNLAHCPNRGQFGEKLE